MALKDNLAAAVRAETQPDPDAIRQTRTPACRYPTTPCGQPPGSSRRVAEPDNLVLEHLEKIQADLARIKTVLSEHTMRFGRLEIAVAGLRRDLAQGEECSAEISVRLDRLAQRVERIERRLELAE